MDVDGRATQEQLPSEAYVDALNNLFARYGHILAPLCE